MIGKALCNFGQHRLIQLLAVLMSVFLVSALCGQTRTAHADAANNFVLNKVVFGANDQIILDLGVLTRDRSDIFLVTSNIFLVPTGMLAPGAFLPDLDPTGIPNVIQAMGGGGFIDETIGFTVPAGTVSGGSWDIVEDANQNNIYDGPADSVFVQAFTVNITTSVPPVMTAADIAIIKLEAASVRDEWNSAINLFELAQLIQEVAGAARDDGIDGLLELLRSRIEASFLPSYEDILANIGLGLPPTPMEWGTEAINDMLNDASAHYAGIAADPPDPDFMQLTSLAPRPFVAPGSNDPLDQAGADLANAVAQEGVIAQAFLASLERYQGAEAAGNGDWALVHARAIKAYAELFADRLGVSNAALSDMAAALTAEPLDFDARAGDIQAIVDQVSSSGFSTEQLQALQNFGRSPLEIEQFRLYLLGLDFTAFSRATLLTRLANIQNDNTEMIAALLGLSTFMDGIIATLSGDPVVIDEFPVADPNGPYAGDEGEWISLDGTGSSTPVGSIVSWEWDSDGDGEFDDAEGATPSVLFEWAAQGLVGLWVTDSNGLPGIGYAAIAVNDINEPPLIDSYDTTDLSPVVAPGDIQEFSVDISDPDGDPVTVEWFLDGISVGTGDVFNFAPVIGDVGLHTLEAVITDGIPQGGTVVQAWGVRVLESDIDGDGYTPTGGDCDNDNADVHPGRSEVVGNGVDDDCDPATEDVDQPPVADFFSSPFPAVFGEEVRFSDASTDPNGDVVAWNWSFGDGGTSTLQNPAHTFAHGGAFPVELTVTDGQGNTDTAGLPLDVFDVAETIRVSEPNLADQDVLGDEANNSNVASDVSDDGRWVVFSSRADNLVLDDLNNEYDIFVRDTRTGEVRLISIHSDGNQGDRGSLYPSMTQDGRFVVFTSNASNLVGELNDAGECVSGCVTDFRWNLYLRDRDTDEDGVYDEDGGVETSQVNLASDGEEIHNTGCCLVGAVSGDGNIIAFQANNAGGGIFVRDRRTGITDLYPKDINGGDSNGVCFLLNQSITRAARHVLSNDGRYVVYMSSGTNLVGEDTDGDGVCDLDCTASSTVVKDVFVTDLQTGKNIQMSVNSLGHPATYLHWQANGSWNPAMSGDGRFVTFASDPDNLIVDEFGVVQPHVNPGQQDIYLHDRDADENGIFDEPGGILTELIHVAPNGDPATGTSLVSDVSDDGRFVVFDSSSRNLAVPEDTNDFLDVFVRDRLTGQTGKVSVHNDGTGGKFHSRRPAISSDGSFISFSSSASNLIGIDLDGNGLCDPRRGDMGCDFNGVMDIFMRGFDTDGDGVAGEDDLCLNSLPGEPVYPDGCGLVPGIVIEKAPDFQQVPGDGEATFTITVRNSGDADLTDVEVADPTAPVCDALIGPLAVDEQTSYECTQTGITEDFTNTATATGTAPLGERVTSVDTADVAVIHPAITIEKRPDVQQVLSGSDLLFSITATNTGDVDLDSVSVADTQTPGCENDLGTLSVGQAVTYSCLATDATADFTNAATVTGLPPAGPAVTDSDTADVVVIHPAIDIEKTPDYQEVEEGGEAVFTISVVNVGDVELRNVTVTDPLVSDCSASLGTLTAGQGVTYDCTATDVTTEFTNTAVASGTPPVGSDVDDSDTAVVAVIDGCTPLPYDFDEDCDIDRLDLAHVLLFRNQPAANCPACDIDGDGMVTVLDARRLVLMCTLPRCAVQ